MACAVLFTCFTGHSEETRFDRHVIDADLPGGYQVEVADVNGDKRPDIMALGAKHLALYENPSWRKRIVTTGKQTPGIISTATADMDGDGKAEIAIAYEFEMNEPTRGSSCWRCREGAPRIRGGSSRSPRWAASTGCGGGTSMGTRSST